MYYNEVIYKNEFTHVSLKCFNNGSPAVDKRVDHTEQFQQTKSIPEVFAHHRNNEYFNGWIKNYYSCYN